MRITFEEFAKAELPRLLKYAAVLTGSSDAAADVCQDALPKAHRRWRRIADLDHPYAYVRRMLTNQWLSDRRRWDSRNVVPAAGDDPVFAGSTPGPEHDQVMRDDLGGRLLALPRRQRAALVLRHYLDLDDESIALELDCAVGTVRSLCSRGAAALRADLTERPGRHRAGDPGVGTGIRTGIGTDTAADKELTHGTF